VEVYDSHASDASLLVDDVGDADKGSGFIEGANSRAQYLTCVAFHILCSRTEIDSSQCNSAKESYSIVRGMLKDAEGNESVPSFNILIPIRLLPIAA